mmetsp:Transcript_9835/g.24543  ORF Transcript_9835/g.24543 Transcript_9835/m.24543 type:complete len:276 (+) Transcript_9835:44-871(+)
MAAATNKVHLSEVKAVVVDIEGTTTPITFVHDVLFPYVLAHLDEHLCASPDPADIAALRALALEDQAQSDSSEECKRFASECMLIPEDSEDIVKREEVCKAVAHNVRVYMKHDRKVTALKQLQGHMWLAGYESGELKGEVYPDVVPALRRWREHAAVRLFVYSSGSVTAQRLLFGFSCEGDLLPLFEGHFDTTIGSKREAESYSRIAAQIGLEPHSVLFLTDSIFEVRAALQAHFRVALSDRPGNAHIDPTELAEVGVPVITSFEQLDINTTTTD